MKILSSILISAFMAVSVVACDIQPEDTGEEIDRKLEQAGDTIDDATDEAADTIDDACEKVSDENC